jgi:hypothetical protein
MSLIRKYLCSKETVLLDHNEKRPKVIDAHNKEEYVSWLSDKIKIENEINDIKKRIRWQETNNRTVHSIFASLYVDPILLDINDDREFELLTFYETLPLQERNDMVKKWVLDGFAKKYLKDG